MKRIIKHAAIVIMAVAAVVGLDPKASAWQIGISFFIAFSIAVVFAYKMDKSANKRNSP